VKRTKRRKADAHEPAILTADEYERLLVACAENPTLALFVLLLGETGMRCESEALHLRWPDVSLDTGFITVVSGRDGHRTKSGKSRMVPMTQRLTAALRKHFAAYQFAAQSEYVFHHGATRRHHEAGGRIGTLRSAFKSAAKRAKLSASFRQHDLRHRRVTTWLAEGKSPVLVMQAMGHSRLETTMVYYKYLPDHLRGLVEPQSAVFARLWPFSLLLPRGEVLVFRSRLTDVAIWRNARVSPISVNRTRSAAIVRRTHRSATRVPLPLGLIV
jgi:integrase